MSYFPAILFLESVLLEEKNCLLLKRIYEVSLCWVESPFAHFVFFWYMVKWFWGNGWSRWLCNDGFELLMETSVNREVSVFYVKSEVLW